MIKASRSWIQAKNHPVVSVDSILLFFPFIFIRLLIIKLISFLRIYLITSADCYLLLNLNSLGASSFVFNKKMFFSISLVKEVRSLPVSLSVADYASILRCLCSSSCFLRSSRKFSYDCYFLISYLMRAMRETWFIKFFKLYYLSFRH
jgi:hypothetical protein